MAKLAKVTEINISKKGVLDQVAEATKPANRLAFAVGSLLGGFIPVASYTVCHHEMLAELAAKDLVWFFLHGVLVLAGLIYSAVTVFSWAKVAFKHPAKALGFVV